MWITFVFVHFHAAWSVFWTLLYCSVWFIGYSPYWILLKLFSPFAFLFPFCLFWTSPSPLCNSTLAMKLLRKLQDLAEDCINTPWSVELLSQSYINQLFWNKYYLYSKCSMRRCQPPNLLIKPCLNRFQKNKSLNPWF